MQSSHWNKNRTPDSCCSTFAHHHIPHVLLSSHPHCSHNTRWAVTKGSGMLPNICIQQEFPKHVSGILVLSATSSPAQCGSVSRRGSSCGCSCLWLWGLPCPQTLQWIHNGGQECRRRNLGQCLIESFSFYQTIHTSHTSHFARISSLAVAARPNSTQSKFCILIIFRFSAS